ncbi:MAG: hypothetical protein A4E59_02892 [Syntrophorhabdus sp. PtaB.Bin027]|nr:MAG: hypothetical protein A4E59_02892 [Syntrophorhabdus sp. PtaB.Bin027]
MTSNSNICGSEDLKQKIGSFISSWGGGVSFVELEQHIPGFRGDYSIGFEDKNIWFWFHCSSESIDAIDELLKEGRISIKTTTPLVYIADGGMPNVPMAKGNRTYKTPRWLPVVFNPVRGKKV